MTGPFTNVGTHTLTTSHAAGDGHAMQAKHVYILYMLAPSLHTLPSGTDNPIMQHLRLRGTPGQHGTL